MHQETISILCARACKTIGRVLTVLVFSTAFLRREFPDEIGMNQLGNAAGNGIE